MNKRKVTADYRSLLLLRIKKRYNSMILGFTTLLILITTGFWLTSSKLKLVKPPPGDSISEKVKGASTSKKQNIRTYVVSEGDSLSIIALKFYGDLYAWEKIAVANKITNPDILEVGSTLIIPE